MYASTFNKNVSKNKKTLIFADSEAEAYTIPASEGWNEGYSQNNKFLYVKDIVTSRTNKNRVASSK